MVFVFMSVSVLSSPFMRTVTSFIILISVKVAECENECSLG